MVQQLNMCTPEPPAWVHPSSATLLLGVLATCLEPHFLHLGNGNAHFFLGHQFTYVFWKAQGHSLFSVYPLILHTLLHRPIPASPIVLAFHCTDKHLPCNFCLQIHHTARSQQNPAPSCPLTLSSCPKSFIPFSALTPFLTASCTAFSSPPNSIFSVSLSHAPIP